MKRETRTPKNQPAPGFNITIQEAELIWVFRQLDPCEQRGLVKAAKNCGSVYLLKTGRDGPNRR